MVRVGGAATLVKETGKLATAGTPSTAKLMVVEPPSWYRTTWSTVRSTM
jgi:hypothetical protein